MIVSKYHNRADMGPEEAAALSWLRRQMVWEQVLDRLRKAAGAESPPTSAQPAPSPRASVPLAVPQPVQDRPAA